MKNQTASSEFLEVTIGENLSEAGISLHHTLDPHPQRLKKEGASDMQVVNMEKLLESASGKQSDDVKGLVGDMPPHDSKFPSVKLVNQPLPGKESKKKTVFSCSDIRMRRTAEKGQNSPPIGSKHGDEIQVIRNTVLLTYIFYYSV